MLNTKNTEKKEIEVKPLVLNLEMIDFKVLNFLLELEKNWKNQLIDWKIYYESNFNIISNRNTSIQILKKEELEWFSWIKYVEYDFISKINLITKEFLTKNKNFEKIMKNKKLTEWFNEIRISAWKIIKENWNNIFLKS